MNKVDRIIIISACAFSLAVGLTGVGLSFFQKSEIRFLKENILNLESNYERVDKLAEANRLFDESKDKPLPSAEQQVFDLMPDEDLRVRDLEDAIKKSNLDEIRNTFLITKNEQKGDFSCVFYRYHVQRREIREVLWFRKYRGVWYRFWDTTAAREMAEREGLLDWFETVKKEASKWEDSSENIYIDTPQFVPKF